MMRYERTDAFSRDLKRLTRKYPSLEDDLVAVQKNAIELRYEKGIDNQSVFEMPGFCSDAVRVAKVKKFACKSLKGTGVRSGMRLVFAYMRAESCVVHLDLYHKNERAEADFGRIREFLALP